MSYERLHNHRRCPGRWLALVFGSGLGLNAYALDAGIRSEYTANQIINSAQAFDKSWKVTGSSSGVTIGKDFTMRGPGGRALQSRMTAEVGARAGMAIGSRVLATLAPAVGVGMLLYDIYDAVRVKPDGSGGLMADPGGAEEEISMYECRVQGSNGYSPLSPGAACSSAAYLATARQKPLQLGPDCVMNIVYSVAPSGGSTFSLYQRASYFGTAPGCSGSTDTLIGTVTAALTVKGACPSYVDSSGFSHPAGQPALTNGACPTGRYEKISAEEAEKRLFDNWEKGQVQVDLAAMWDDILGRSIDPLMIPSGTKIEAAEPSPNPLPGPVTVTQNSDGTSTEVATGWTFTRIADDFNKKTDFKVTETKREVKRDKDGKIISESTTGTTGETAGDKNKACDANPGALGCIGLGDVPKDEVPRKTKDIVWTSAVLGLPVGCPVGANVAGLTVSYAETCNAAIKMKPFILAAAAFSALMIVLAAVRGN